MWPDQVSNPGPLTYESGALPTVLRGPAHQKCKKKLPFTSRRQDKYGPEVIKLFSCSTQLSSKKFKMLISIKISR